MDKNLSRAYQAPVPAGQVIDWIGSPPHNAGVLPLLGQGFNGAHFPQLLEQHGDAVLPTKAPVDGVYPVVGHGQQGDVQLVSNDTDVNFDETAHDFGETIQGFKAIGDTIIVWANYGRVWGSTDGGNNFTLLPAYLNSGSTAYDSASRIIGDIKFGNGVWVVTFGDFIAICRSDILVPANWAALPRSFGSLTNGITRSNHKLATDGNGTWLAAGEWHQFAWTNDDWLTINITNLPNGANGASLKIPYPQNSDYSTDAFCWCSDDGVFFAGSERQNVIYRSDDGLNTWVAITYKFNTGVNVNTSNPQDIVDMGNGHYMVNYNSTYFAETFDYGASWVRRASYLGLGSYGVRSMSTDKKGMLLAAQYNSGMHIYTSKNEGQTFASDIAQPISVNHPVEYWRDAWYAISDDNQKLVRSLSGYIRTEWELV